MMTHEAPAGGRRPAVGGKETELVRRRYDRGAWRYDLMVWPMDVMAMDRFRRRLFRFVDGTCALEVGVREMDVQALGYTDATFDTVVSTCVFCSVPDPVRGLREIRRVLRPSGKAVFLEHVRPRHPWLAALFDRLDPLVARAGPHINRRTVENIVRAGLRIEREENLIGSLVKLIVARP